MATSSIFHNFIIEDPAAVERFVLALEESAADPGPVLPDNCRDLRDPEEVRAFMRRWEEVHGEQILQN